MSSSGPRPCILAAGRELLVELGWLILALRHTPAEGIFVWRSKMGGFLQIESVEGKDKTRCLGKKPLEPFGWISMSAMNIATGLNGGNGLN